ncbi:MAG TPA: hypothetical protein VJT71_04110 [Pyrinomonadaceae bacterium]|nr:hypothetical protein [Pyrinomonadaceae bacterium]
MNGSLKQNVTLLLVVVTALLCSSCSFINSFIVVNASRASLTVSYRVKPPNLPGAPTALSNRAPETLPVAQLDNEVPWQPLPSSRYKIDADNRFVTLTLNPDEALLLARCRPAHNASTGDCESDAFDVAEIGLIGANGEIKLAGEQAHKTFVRNKNTYILTYY